MVALYDGSLRMADDAVGVVFDALKEDGRWDDSLILITADHGEAFFEHGVQGHNTTLYDEMIRIPFILRLPDRSVADSANAGRLVILSDVVPTILRRVGLEVRPEVGGQDLFRTTDNPRARALVLRKVKPVEFAVRTLRWKAVFSLSGRKPKLFDLERDPGELANLVDRHPLLHHGFAALVTRARLQSHERSLKVETVGLPQEDLRELRSLGYLR